MFGGILLQVLPQLWRKGVFVRDVRFQNVCQYRFGADLRQVESKGNVMTEPSRVETNNEDAFAVLRYIKLSVDHLVKNAVPQFFKRLRNDLEGPALVVTGKVFNVFQKKSLGAFGFQNAADIKKKRSLGFVLEARGTAEGIFLRYAGNGEWLAGKTRHENVVIRDAVLVDFGNVAVGHVAKVGVISLLAELVPLAGVDAAAAVHLKAQPHASDAGKQVDEGKGCRFPGHFLQCLAQ